jgi:serine/threonine-protein kinase BUR1
VEQEGFPITAIREIKLLKNLHHPNIIDLIEMAYEFSSGENKILSIYMVFSYMDHDLTGLLERKEIIFSLPQAKCYMSQLLHGLKYLHERQVLHRDIKGSNILLNNRGELRLTDFGLSRPLEEGRKEYTPGVYTRWYRPPELLMGSKQYGNSADMWGVGCILAEIFIKRPLFPGDDDFEQIQQVSRVCGTPSSQTMSNFEAFPNSKKLHLPVFRRKIREHFEKLEPLAVDLIDKLLVLDPKNRLSAKEALEHSFFTALPLPALPQR